MFILHTNYKKGIIMLGLYYGGLGEKYLDVPMPVASHDEAEKEVLSILNESIANVKEGAITVLYPLFFVTSKYDELLNFENIFDDDPLLKPTISFFVEHDEASLLGLAIATDTKKRISVRLARDICLYLKGIDNKSEFVETKIIEYILNNLAKPSELAFRGKVGLLTPYNILLIDHGVFRFYKNYKYKPMILKLDSNELMDFKISNTVIILIDEYAKKNELTRSDIIRKSLS